MRVLAALAVLAFALAGCAGTDGGQLTIGTLLPITGGLSAYGPGMRDGVDMAVAEVNAAGGVNGQPMRVVHEDDRTDPAQAPTAFQSLRNQGIAAVVGPAGSAVVGSILDAAVDAQVVVVTPSATSPEFSGRDNGGYFFRIPPSDALQGKVLAALVREDGHDAVSILALDNSYGVGLGQVFRSSFEQRGGRIVQDVRIEETGTTFRSQVQQAAQGQPDAIVLLAYPQQGVQVMREAVETGVLGRVPFYFSEGLRAQEGFVDAVGQGADGKSHLRGMKGTVPEEAASAGMEGFKARFKQRFGKDPTLFAAESYDAVIAIALAAEHGDTSDGRTLKDHMRTVYNKAGANVTAADLADALQRAGRGEDVNYVGVTSDFDWDDNGDPTSGIYSVWQVNPEGKIVTLRSGLIP